MWSCDRRTGAQGFEDEFSCETDQFNTEFRLLVRGMLIHWPGLLCIAAIKSKQDRGNKTWSEEIKTAEIQED